MGLRKEEEDRGAESSTIHRERLELTTNDTPALREIARSLSISQAGWGSCNVNDAVRNVMQKDVTGAHTCLKTESKGTPYG